MRLSLIFVFAAFGVLIGIALICEACIGAVKIDKEIQPSVSKSANCTLHFLLGCTVLIVCIPFLMDLPYYLNNRCVESDAIVKTGDNLSEFRILRRSFTVELSDGTELRINSFCRGLNEGYKVHIKVLPLTKHAEISAADTDDALPIYTCIAVFAVCILILTILSKQIRTFKKSRMNAKFSLFSADADSKSYSSPVIKIVACLLVVLATVFFLFYWNDYVSIFQMVLRYLYSIIIAAACLFLIVPASKEIFIVRKNRAIIDKAD